MKIVLDQLVITAERARPRIEHVHRDAHLVAIHDREAGEERQEEEGYASPQRRLS